MRACVLFVNARLCVYMCVCVCLCLRVCLWVCETASLRKSVCGCLCWFAYQCVLWIPCPSSFSCTPTHKLTHTRVSQPQEAPVPTAANSVLRDFPCAVLARLPCLDVREALSSSVDSPLASSPSVVAANVLLQLCRLLELQEGLTGDVGSLKLGLKVTHTHTHQSCTVHDTVPSSF